MSTMNDRRVDSVYRLDRGVAAAHARRSLAGALAALMDGGGDGVMSAGRRDVARVCLLLLLSPTLIASSPSPGADVAMEHLAVAKQFATHNVSLSTDYANVMKIIWDHGCNLPRRVRSGLDSDARRLASLYIKRYCQPWVDFWNEAMKPCGSCNSPEWCDFDTMIRFRLDLIGYLGAMVSGLDAAPSGLEKKNMMDMVSRALSARTVANNFPRPFLEEWAGKATIAYLKTASAEEVITLANCIHPYWFRTSPPVRQAFADYMSSSQTISPAGRDTIESQLAEEPEP